VCCEADRAEGKEHEEAGEGEAVKSEAQPLKLQVRQKINYAYALLLCQQKHRSTRGEYSYKVPQQAPMKHVHRVYCQP
jgi:hypothetical protein